MSSHLAVYVLLLTLLSSLTADTNTTDYSFGGYIDEKQKNISDSVNSTFRYIDRSIGGLFSASLDNQSCDNQEKRLDEAFYSEDENIFDQFFQNEKFLDETEKSFLRLRLYSTLQSKDSTAYNYKIRAQIPLSRTKKNFSLFIEDIKEDYINEANPDEKDDNAPDIGVNFFSEKYHGIKSKYSIGTSGLNLYARARFSRPFQAGKWVIEPVQEFKFSIRDDWQEYTSLYFDRKLKENSLFRIGLSRQTQAHVDGMDYRVWTTYYITTKNKSGLSISQSFWGNTKYRTTIYEKQHSNISDFSTSINWRQSIWRKWFAYEIQPAVSFHRQYDFQPNYILRLNLDFYFGNI